MTWEVSDGVLTTVVERQAVTAASASVGSFGVVSADEVVDSSATLSQAQVSVPEVVAQPLQIDLRDHTIYSLAGYIAAQPGYVVEYVSDDPDVSGLSAAVLLDASGDQSMSNGDHLYAYTSLLWAWMEAVASELMDAAAAIASAPRQMVVRTATGDWLDLHGGYFAVDRNAAETDPDYATRILASIGRPAGNNVALEMAINVITGGLQARVVDDPAQDFSGGTFGTGQSYGLFSVVYDIDLDGGDLINAYTQRVTDVVARLRDAGTHMSSISINGTLSDSYSVGSLALETFSTVSMTISTFVEDASFKAKRHNGQYRRDGSYLRAYDGSTAYDGTHYYGWNPGPLVLFDSGSEGLQITLTVSGVEQPPEDV